MTSLAERHSDLIASSFTKSIRPTLLNLKISLLINFFWEGGVVGKISYGKGPLKLCSRYVRSFALSLVNGSCFGGLNSFKTTFAYTVTAALLFLPRLNLRLPSPPRFPLLFLTGAISMSGSSGFSESSWLDELLSLSSSSWICHSVTFSYIPSYIFLAASVSFCFFCCLLRLASSAH